MSGEASAQTSRLAGASRRGHSVDKQSVVVLTEALGSKSWVQGTRERKRRVAQPSVLRASTRCGLAARIWLAWRLGRALLWLSGHIFRPARGGGDVCLPLTSLLLSGAIHTAIIRRDRRRGCLRCSWLSLVEETPPQKHVNSLHTHRFSTSRCRGLRVRPALVVGLPLRSRRPRLEIWPTSARLR